MRFYSHQHQFYCGIDLHARSMFLCIMDHKGKILLHPFHIVLPLMKTRTWSFVMCSRVRAVSYSQSQGLIPHAAVRCSAA